MGKRGCNPIEGCDREHQLSYHLYSGTFDLEILKLHLKYTPLVWLKQSNYVEVKNTWDKKRESSVVLWYLAPGANRLEEAEFNFLRPIHC